MAPTLSPAREVVEVVLRGGKHFSAVLSLIEIWSSLLKDWLAAYRGLLLCAVLL